MRLHELGHFGKNVWDSRQLSAFFPRSLPRFLTLAFVFTSPWNGSIKGGAPAFGKACWVIKVERAWVFKPNKSHELEPVTYFRLGQRFANVIAAFIGFDDNKDRRDAV
jgi:hypothetical protein